MATINQIPDSLSLLRNLKPLIATSASPIVLTLVKDGTTLIEETYHPDPAGKIEVDLRELVAPHLKTVLPSSDIYEQANGSAVFTALVDDVSVATFRVVNAGVRKLSTTPTLFLKANWLTWQPQVKKVTWDAPETLSYFFAVAAVVKAKFYLIAGSSKTITIGSYAANSFKTFNTRMSYLFGLSGEETDDLYGYVDVWVETPQGVELSYVQRYVFEPKQGDEKIYLCENSLGGIDTFVFRGALTQGSAIEHASAAAGDARIDITTEIARSWEQKTGALGIRAARWVFELLSSRQAWMIQDGNAEPIVISADQTSLPDSENVHSLTFSFTLSEERALQNYARTTGNLTEIEVQSPSGDIFFLRARLADFPAADLAEEILFLAQTPFTEEWKKVSLSALAEAIGGGEGGGTGDGTWQGHFFDDWMDQPVRTTDDVAFHKVTTPTVQSPSFSEGALGAGFRLFINQQGRAALELDDITVRRTMKVFEAIIQQIKHQGGMVIWSAASMECSRVEAVTGGYKCYFDSKEGQIPNEFVVGDQARCQRFDLGTTTPKYYWRLVTAVGSDYIILSDTDCDADSDTPSAGDNIVQLGNRNNTSRQSARVTTTIDANSPRDDYYKGINSYDLTGKLITTVGVKDGEVGVWTENGEFKGQVTITGGSGLQTLTEWNDMSWNISSAWDEALAASAAAGAAQLTANQAVLAASTAQGAADAAGAAAQALGTQLADWADDGKISPVEKDALRQQKADVSQEYTELVARATRYGVGYSAFTAAYTAALAALTKYTAATPAIITVESDYDDIAAYYTARVTLLNAIATAEKNRIDTAQADATAAQGTADRALAKAEAVAAILAEINDDTVLDLVEKNIIRTQWITINGIEDLGRTGSKGTYAATKALAGLYGNIGTPDVITYHGVEVTYNGQHIYYSITGLSALDASYVALREFLRGVGLNDRDHVFQGFDRDRFAALLMEYSDAEVRAIDNVNRAISYQMSAFESAVQANIDEMQGQLDNTIDYWFGYHGVPTASNAPASNWTTESARKDHLGDVYYDEDTGFGYRWQKDSGGTYYWNQLQDDAAIRALAAAAEAKDTADGKRRVFLAQPGSADAYDPGDLWLHATAGSFSDETLVCQTAKSAGSSFSISHWRKASKYTDDTVANAASALASQANTAASNASAAATQAQTVANNAQTTAQAAADKLANWASDSKISPVEKAALRQQKADVVSEHTALAQEATAYNISVTSFNAAYTAAVAAFDKYTAATPEIITVDSDYADIAAYYTARAAIAQAVAQKAKEGADAAQSAADSAQAAADLASDAAQDALDAADAVAAAVAGIDIDTKLDEAEKAAIRVTWTAINGIPSTGSAGQGGTYHGAKVALQEAGSEGHRAVITFSGTEITYNSAHIYYNITGENRLDAAFLALREYLNGCQIGAPGAFIGFNRELYAELIRDYQVALNNVLQILSDVAKDRAAAADAKATSAGTAAGAAQDAADAAQSTANAAQTAASNANTAIAAWANDGWISPVEKRALQQQRNDIAQEYTAIITEAGKYGVATTTFTSKRDLALAVLDYYTASATWSQNTQISGSYPLSRISDYYSARTTILDSIATAAKKVATDAQTDADAALDAIDTINSVLAKFSSDGYISPTEKRSLKQAHDDDTRDITSILAAAAQYTGASAIIGATLVNQLNSAIAAVNTASTGKWALYTAVVNYYTQDAASPNRSTTWAWEDNVPISGSYPLSRITDYYTARDTLIKKINECGKAYAEGYATSQANTKASAAEDALAQKLGYTDFADMAAQAAASKTIIDGGYIRTALIRAAAIAADAAFIEALAASSAFIEALVVKHMRTKDNKVIIQDDGTIKAVDVDLTGKMAATSGSITDLVAKRLMNPFTPAYTWSSERLEDDTMYKDANGNISLTGYLQINLPWDTNQSGRRLCYVGSFEFSAPSNANHWYYENGNKVKSFQTSFEITELIGLGTTSKFFGWLVVNRSLLATNYNHGRTLRPLAYGKVQGTASGANFVYDSGSNNYMKKIRKFNNDSDDIYVSRGGTGIYYLWLPLTWFVNANHIFCQVNGMGPIAGGSAACFANVYGVTTGYYASASRYRVEIRTADDSSLNDGGFHFMIFNMASWDD